MKLEVPVESMKVGPSSASLPMEDDFTVAAAALALAVEQTRRAIVDARNAPSPASIALTASQQRCESLEDKIVALKDTMRLYQQQLSLAHAASAEHQTELTAVRAQGEGDLRSLRTTLALRDAEVGRLSTLAAQRQTEAVATTAAQSDKERAAVASMKAELAAERETLRAARALLEADQAKLLADKRAALANLQRTVGTMQAEVAQASNSSTQVASTSKRPKKASHPKSRGSSTTRQHPYPPPRGRGEQSGSRDSRDPPGSYSYNIGDVHVGMYY
ncbi:hypothetical protein C8R46DRAFT_1196754 [Mycena filopes]|nr:hypothetical protein C8R46DRAFT_1196754 [Mycena filopes]